MKKVVDLIIPYYNSSNTLERLFASIVMQSFKEKIQVILVNDCSTDNKHLQEIEKFSNMLDIEIVNLNENLGPGAARREGFLRGKSKYIMYIDADDTFQNPFAVEELVTIIETKKLDAVNSTFIEMRENGECEFHKSDWIWTFGKIYRRKFLTKNKILMNNTRANEDTGYNTIVSNVGKVGSLEDNTYIWHYKKDSITRKDGCIYSFFGVEGWVDNMIWSIKEILRINSNYIIVDLLTTCMITLYRWYNDFVYTTDKRVDLNLYRGWCNKLYRSFEMYKTIDFELYQAPFIACDCKVSNRIPKITFQQFLYEVGEGYGK